MYVNINGKNRTNFEMNKFHNIMKNNELTLAEVRAMYFDADALILSPVRLFRYQSHGDRFYFYLTPDVDEHGAKTLIQKELFSIEPPELKMVVKLAIGATTLASAVIPFGVQMTKWYCNLGWDAAIAYRDERSKYGSLMHTCDAELFINRRMDLDKIPEIVAGYMAKNKIDYDRSKWSDDLKSDILAMVQFIRDYNVKPLAIELSLVSPELGVAGTLDLFCEMDATETGYFGEVYKSGDRKGEPKETKRTNRVLAIIDFKSGRNGSSQNDQHIAQLVTLRRLLTETMESVYGVDLSTQLIRLYNWHPKEWKTRPDYTLNEQTNKINCSDDEYVRGLLWHYRIHNPDPTLRNSVEISGVVEIDAGVEPNVSVETIMAIAQKRIESGDEIPVMIYETVDDYLTTEPAATTEEIANEITEEMANIDTSNQL